VRARPSERDPGSEPGLPRKYIGPRWLGPTYTAMMRRDPHAPGSVDRLLLARMIGIDPQTVDSLYAGRLARRVPYRMGSRPLLEVFVRRLAPNGASPEARIRATAKFVSQLGLDPAPDLDSLRFGGTEEEIIARGSDWCTDVARVACALLQVAGVPSRLVFLADTRRAYSGHAIVEAYRAGRWGAVDPLTAVIYLTDSGEPATTWDLMAQPKLVRRHFQGRSTPYTRAGQFRVAALAEYPIGRPDAYNYKVSRANPYYRSILKMSEQGWPGGLRWLHGEDSEA
jgi:transglutaminase-like putative cysteine protease